MNLKAFGWSGLCPTSFVCRLHLLRLSHTHPAGVLEGLVDLMVDADTVRQLRQMPTAIS